MWLVGRKNLRRLASKRAVAHPQNPSKYNAKRAVAAVSKTSLTSWSVTITSSGSGRERAGTKGRARHARGRNWPPRSSARRCVPAIPLVCRERPPMVKNDRLPSTPIFEKDFGPIVCFDFTHDRSPIAVKLAQHCRWCSRPMARCARRSRRSSGLTNRGSTVRLKTAQGGGSWVSPCRPSPARQ
jgi:hypothetical protein